MLSYFSIIFAYKYLSEPLLKVLPIKIYVMIYPFTLVMSSVVETWSE